jgi:N-methylhydantoinase A
MNRVAETLLGVDTGGTFTDFVVDAPEGLLSFKIRSTPEDPARAVAEGVRRIRSTPGELLHGTTVATNALLERRGARTAIVTTRGFEDLIAIGRQARPSLYDWEAGRPEPLIPRHLRLGVDERTDARGRILRRPRPADLARCARVLRRARIESLAVCFLHSYASARNERAAAAALRRALPHLCCSSSVLPEHREFERFSTAVLSAYLTPVLAHYLRSLVRRVSCRALRVLRSDGTMLGARAAAREAAHSLLSGPAAGVVACAEMGRRLRLPRLLSLDMGGTSTDVCLIEGTLPLRRRWQVGGWPVALPCLAIETVGAGGGSIARIDEGGVLRVGPQSAGADPGPVCWGRGRQLTVTDAHLFLGRLDPAEFARQGIRLHPRRVAARMRVLARALRVPPGRAAEGILRVVEAEMERALRRTSVEQGHDPRRFTLIAFGGAGGLHAVSLARRLGIRRVLVPPSAGTFSALGLLLGPRCMERSATVLGRIGSWREARPVLRRLQKQAGAALAADTRGARPRFELRADLRYRGQAHELSVPAEAGAEARFHREHARRFGIAEPLRQVEWVALRVRVWASPPRLGSLRVRAADAARGAPQGSVPEWTRSLWEGRWRRTRRVVRESLRPGAVVRGPALILEYGATVALPPGARARAGAQGSLWIDA